MLAVTNVERLDMLDDTAQMWLVTLSISNSNDSARSGPMFVSEGEKPFEAKVANQWIPIEARIGLRNLNFRPYNVDLILPAMADACRANLKWTDARLAYPVDECCRCL
jgi:hypothetical protein